MTSTEVATVQQNQEDAFTYDESHSVSERWWTLELATKATNTGRTHVIVQLRFKVSDSGSPKERTKWNKEWRIMPG